MKRGLLFSLILSLVGGSMPLLAGPAQIFTTQTMAFGNVHLTLPAPTRTKPMGLLFVIDDSGSMHSFQSALAQQVESLSKLAKKSMGPVAVITTTTQPMNAQILDPQASLFEVAFSKALQPGINGDGNERPFESLVNFAKQAPGFFAYRDILVVLVTDEEDGSHLGPQDTLKEISTLGHQTHVVAAIVPTGETRCQSGAGQDPKRIEELVGVSGGSIVSLCEPNFGERVAEEAAKKMSSVPGTLISYSEVVLPNQPIVDTIVVKWAGAKLRSDARRGWSYNSAKNAIVFGADIDWDLFENSEIEISYKAAF